MDHRKETAETWNKIAGLYQERFMDLTIYNDTYDIFCNAITTPSPRVLEIGCGPGNVTRYLLAKRNDCILEAIDIAPNMVELARQNNPGASFTVMDCRDINQLTRQYDGIICGFCLPYLSETEALTFITDAAKLINPGGTFYISFVEGTPEQSGYQTNSEGDRMYFQYHNLQHISDQLKQHGFQKNQILKVPYQRSDGTTEMHTVVIGTMDN